MNRKLWLTCLSLGILAFAMAFAACGDDDDATPDTDGQPGPGPDSGGRGHLHKDARNGPRLRMRKWTSFWSTSRRRP